MQVAPKSEVAMIARKMPSEEVVEESQVLAGRRGPGHLEEKGPRGGVHTVPKRKEFKWSTELEDPEGSLEQEEELPDIDLEAKAQAATQPTPKAEPKTQPKVQPKQVAAGKKGKSKKDAAEAHHQALSGMDAKLVAEEKDPNAPQRPAFGAFGRFVAKNLRLKSNVRANHSLPLLSWRPNIGRH